MCRLAIQVLLGLQTIYLVLATIELFTVHSETLFAGLKPGFWYVLFVGLITEAICDEIAKNRKRL